MDRMPNELLLDLFKQYFSVTDRLRISLVCRKWHHICQHIAIKRKEKLIFSKFLDLEHVGNILQNSTRESLNLKFQLYKFVDSLHFWKICGDKIKQLEFHLCHFSSNAFEFILMECRNLEILSLVDTVEKEGQPHWLKGFGTLAEKKIVYPSLTRFKFKDGTHSRTSIPGIGVRDSTIKNMFYVLPNLQKLQLLTVHLTDCRNGEEYFSCQFFKDCAVSMLPQLEELHIAVLESGCCCQKLITQAEFPKLKIAKFYVCSISACPDYPHEVYTFDAAFKSINRTSIQKFGSDLNRPTWSLPPNDSTHHLHFDAQYRQITNAFDFKNLLSSLIKSSLRSIHFGYHPPRSKIPHVKLLLSSKSSLPCNNTVQRLNISSDRCEESLFLIFLKYFPAVTQLTLRTNCIWITHKIFQYLPKLRKLVLLLSYYKNPSFDKQFYSIFHSSARKSILPLREISGLEELEIDSYFLNTLLAEGPVSLKNLRYLIVNSFFEFEHKENRDDFFINRNIKNKLIAPSLQSILYEGLFLDDYRSSQFFDVFSAAQSINHIGLHFRTDELDIEDSLLEPDPFFKTWKLLQNLIVDHYNYVSCYSRDFHSHHESAAIMNYRYNKNRQEFLRVPGIENPHFIDTEDENSLHCYESR